MGFNSGWIIRAVAAATLGAAVAGCQFAVVPPKHHPHPKPSAGSDTAAIRLADAPPLLVQCAISQAGLRPGSQDWLRGNTVVINSSDAGDFHAWWRAHDTPGPYHQTFLIDRHHTHYLAFGATWVHRHGQWVPAHTALSDPLAERTSLYAYAVWTAAHDRLPPAVCGTSASIHQLQQRVFGTGAADPW